MRRLFWASAGYTLGLGSSIWVQRRVRTALGTCAPEHVGRRAREGTRVLAERARRAVADVHEAAAEGRLAMRESERALRAEFGQEPAIRSAARPFGASRPVPVPTWPGSR